MRSGVPGLVDLVIVFHARNRDTYPSAICYIGLVNLRQMCPEVEITSVSGWWSLIAFSLNIVDGVSFITPANYTSAYNPKDRTTFNQHMINVDLMP